MEDARNKLWPILRVGWSVWPALQMINLSLVPIPLQPLFVSGAGLFWNMYVSLIAQGSP